MPQDDPNNFTFECVVPPPKSVAATVVPPKKPILPLSKAALPSVADMPFIPPENWTGGLATSMLPGVCNADLPSDSTRNRYIWVRLTRLCLFNFCSTRTSLVSA